jgi:hypothetical protein
MPITDPVPITELFVDCPQTAACPSPHCVSTVDLPIIDLVCPLHPVTPMRIDYPTITSAESTLNSCTCVRVCVYAIDHHGWNVHRFHIAPTASFGQLTAYWAHMVNMPHQFVRAVFWNDDTPTVDADLLVDCPHVSPSRVLRLFTYTTALAQRHWNVLQELRQKHGWKIFSDHPPAHLRVTERGTPPW